MSSPANRVVITGLGIVSPIGNDLESVWSNLESGRSGIRPWKNLPQGVLPVQHGAEAQEFTGQIADYGPLEKSLQRSIKKNMKVMCREIEMGVAASQKALHHAALGQVDPDRAGCVFGSDYILTRPEEFADGVRSCRAAAGGQFHPRDWPTHGLPKVGPLWLLKYLPNMPNSHVSIYNDFRGPNNAITVREASMFLAVAEAVSIIRRGAADVMLVGCTGSRLHPMRSVNESKAFPIATDRDPPSSMARPFDQSAEGIVLGEGAATIVLESFEHAQRRGADLWGEVVGSASGFGGGTPQQLRDTIQRTLQASRSGAGDRWPDVWHLSAHGWGIPEVDRQEADAISAVLDGSSGIPVVCPQSYYGNLGAGGGGVSLVASLLALRHGRLFPTLNLDTPLPEAKWTASRGDEPAGGAFLAVSHTLHGQTCALAIASV
ncbi:MAG: beta-ketoacyl-[acyl-carrier-protein] synthase family protein [Planctomycetota bacterium]|nr:MAG: beta-ketoacyl-[acyl-carrier-protein] synthase family protein [Planctomycetota bacterium]